MTERRVHGKENFHDRLAELALDGFEADELLVHHGCLAIIRGREGTYQQQQLLASIFHDLCKLLATTSRPPASPSPAQAPAPSQQQQQTVIVKPSTSKSEATDKQKR